MPITVIGPENSWYALDGAKLKLVQLDFGDPINTSLPTVWGYVRQDKRWNGWAIPYFDRDQLPAVAAFFYALNPDYQPSIEANGTFCIAIDPDNRDDHGWTRYHPIPYGDKELFPVGAGELTWDEWVPDPNP